MPCSKAIRSVLALLAAALLGALWGGASASAGIPPIDTRCAQPGEAIATQPWAQSLFQPQRYEPFATGAGQIVAVIDSGVDANHPQLNRGKVLPGVDYLFNGTGNGDCNGHGTAVASIIAGRGQYRGGMQGLARGARILPIVVSEGRLTNQGVVEGAVADVQKFANAIRYAVGQGAKVINLSLALFDDFPAVKSAIEYAIDQNVVLVAAAGNIIQQVPITASRTVYPAAYAGVIGVGSIDAVGKRSQDARAGSWVDLVAPGEQVVAAQRGGGYQVVKGTSFATAFVSATAALIRARFPTLPADEVEDRLYATADPIGNGKREEFGHGLVNPYRAVTERLTNDPPAVKGPYEEPPPDPAAQARAAHWSWMGRIGLGMAAIGAAVAAGLVVTAGALPLGRRRGWRPGRAKPPREPSDVEAATTSLYEGLDIGR